VFEKMRRHEIGQVFTPRKTDINRDIYVERPELEKNLRRQLEGTKHVVVHGESGSGKSWLYRKVLADLDAKWIVANSANAQRTGTLTGEIANAAGIGQQKRLTGESEEFEAKANAGFVAGGMKSKREYATPQEDQLITVFEVLRNRAGTARVVVVIDNLELIVGSADLMNELASLITLLDDERYAQYQVKFLLVGVPSVLREYFSKTPAAASVSNRLGEVDEISSLAQAQVFALVEKGFKDLLFVDVSEADLSTWKNHIYTITMGYAQAVQEYCEQLAYVVEDCDWHGRADQLAQADSQFLKQALSHASVVVSSRMNERATRVGRRDQVLYVLGRITSRTFSPAAVEVALRIAFPESTADTTLAIGQIMAELAQGDNAIIRQVSGTQDYVFRDARYAMALRVLLAKDAERQKVLKVEPKSS
jgi:hypothetical protein